MCTPGAPGHSVSSCHAARASCHGSSRRPSQRCCSCSPLPQRPPGACRPLLPRGVVLQRKNCLEVGFAWRAGHAGDAFSSSCRLSCLCKTLCRSCASLCRGAVGCASAVDTACSAWSQVVGALAQALKEAWAPYVEQLLELMALTGLSQELVLAFQAGSPSQCWHGWSQHTCESCQVCLAAGIEVMTALMCRR